MNDGDSAGEKPNIGFTPAVVNRRSIPNSSASLVIPISGSAVPISQMSQLPESTENTCFVDKELKIRAPLGKHGKYVLCGPSPRISVEQSDNSSQPPDNQPIQIVNADAGTSTPSIPQNTSWRSQPNSQTLTHPSSSNINNSSIQTLIVKSGNVDGNNFLKSPPPQYSSLHQTPRQIRTTQNAFVSSSNNSVSNNCDSNSLNEISTTVTSQTGVPATIDSAEGTKTVSSTLTSIKSNQNPTTDTLFSSTVNQQQSIARKRSGSSLSSDADSINTCKKRNISYRFLRMKQIQAKHADHVAEIYFLQTGGNMMDFPTWRKKPENQKTPDYLNFSKQYQLESESLTKVSATASTTATTSAIQQTHPPPLISTNSPHGVEIKIPGVGVTPVAISKTLPAAVVQLSQLGNVPGRPQGGRHGMVFGQIPVSSITVPLVPGGTPLVPDTPKQSTKKSYALSTPTNTQQTPNATAGSSNGPQEQFLKVRQEASVMQRISELQREGLWTEKRLPKLQEPQRPKAHWDYLLEEMVWLAADFAQERKWKKAAAKKCARMVQKYFSDKALAAQKAEKAKELQLKRIAGFLSKEIKIFWSNVEKLVEFKQQTKIKEKRKKALDQHLSFIVDQTEKYSQQLAVGMNKSVTDTANTSAAVSLNSSRRSSPRRDAPTDDEFSPGNASSDDDEETIAKEEEEQATDTKAEIAALQRESLMDLDDLDFLSDYLKNRDKIILSDVDDDATNAGPAKKPTLRKRTADVDIKVEDDESNETHSGSTVSRQKQDKMELDSDDDSTAADDDDDDDDSDQADEDDDEGEMAEEETDTDFGLKSLLEEDENKQSQADKDDLINDAAAIAESIQPKGNTLSSTNVVTPVPFLLRHTLREYQHIGLDWLVTMHDRKLNGILADEMGLGKTIQTISLLAHLACVKGNWGPHLIVVPSSVMLNWEMEFKKWCPGFKILTYYGSQKERKQKRIGWTKVNAFHVCITSYKLVIQDHQSFRRKKWKYLILDEAQNIKNFKSQRWQLLLNFQTEQRLLLTGTPLQNNLMELWSLMHFLMPHVFQSHSEFKEWFSNPMTGMIEGNSEYNDSIIKRLHKVLRPFLLRRLKCEVEKQMPKKYEHVVMCRLSKRQRFLYDDFMSRANTRETLASGNLLSVINVLMQLRKVCNHPNMFETRPTVSPFRMDGINMHTASIVSKIFEYDPLKHIDLSSLNLLLVALETSLSAYVAYFARKTQTPRKLIEEIDAAPDPPPKCPEGQFKMFMRIREATVSNNISTYSTGVKIGTSPAMKTEGTKIVPVNSNLLARNSNNNSNRKTTFDVNSSLPSGSGNTVATNTSKNLVSTQNDLNYTTSGLIHENTITIPPLTASTSISQASMMGLRKRIETADRTIATGTAAGMLQTAQIFQTSGGRQIILTPSNNGTTMIGPGGQRLQLIRSSLSPQNQQQRFIRSQQPITKAKIRGTYPASVKVTTLVTPTTSNAVPIPNTTNVNSQLTSALAKQLKTHSYALASGSIIKDEIEPKEVIDDIDTEFDIIETEEMLKERRKHKLQFLAKMNRRRCAATPMYGSDLREAMTKLFNTSSLNHCETSKLSWMNKGYMTCFDAMLKADNWSLNKCIKSIVDRTDEMKDIFNNFVLFVPPVSAPIPSLHISHPHPSKLNNEQQLERAFARDISPKLTLLHPIVSAMSTQFPDPRLIQYDCGKLQTLNRLLRELKDNQHRVLIFTQMTRMLDVLEAFLNYHGHIYLRLDGSTKIEQRQILMDRFNNDKRIFAFILSTRSGGVGINLTGADTVIFYDSDWNPTMDAQAQDRCHRIGQTRDVHIYRLVSEKTIEENILKKANQKRLLGDLAIEGGNFTTAYFKSSSIQELFNVNSAEDDASNRLAEVLERDKERRSRLQDNLASTSTASNVTEDRNAIGAFESALAAAEDEQDVQAAKIASAEADADLAEFDESIPIEDSENKVPELSKAEQEVENLVKQLSPIEQYAMRFVEETGGSWTAEQLRAAEAEIEQQKREWEANRLAALQKQEEDEKRAAEEDDLLTYSREDAQNQIWISDNTMELMPLWSPPTPPQDDSDLYIDYSLCFLYEQELIPESELPPIYVKKEIKRSRNEAGFLVDGRRPMKIRKEDNYFPPRSLFDRPSPALAKLRRDLKLQRYRGNFKPIHMQQVQSSIYTMPQSVTANQQPQITVPGQPLTNAQPQIQTKPLVEPEGMAEWAIYEDAAILNVIQNIQGLPLNLLVLSPGHTPNWDFVADVVNQISRVYRPPKQCRYRYEAVIVPREEGKLIENPKKQPKKSKNPFKPPSPPKTIRALRTSQLFINDNNNAFTKLMKSNFDFIKAAYMKRAPQLKQVLVNPSMKNPKHAAVLSEFGVTNYDQPLSPIDIAARRAEKIKERNRNLPGSIQQQQQQQTVQQLQIQAPQIQQAQGTKITTHIPAVAAGQPQVNQQQQQQQQLIQLQQQVQGGTVTQVLPSVATIVQAAHSLQASRAGTHQQQQQIVKVVPASPQTSNIMNTVQHVPISQTQQIQQTQHHIQSQNPQTQQAQGTTQSVQTSSQQQMPTLHPVQQQAQSQVQTSQIVSIQQAVIPTSSTVASQAASGQIVQTIPAQVATSQVVSVSQLAGVGTVFTTTSGLPSNVTTSSLRTQRIVTASVSGLNAQNVTQTQIQPSQLRLSMGGNQQVVTKGGIPMMMTTGKPITQPTQFQIVRQNSSRQQFKVLNAGQGNTVLQTVGGQVSVVNQSGAIIQGGIVTAGGNVGQALQLQPTSGQKVSLAVTGVSGSPSLGTNVASVATVQMNSANPNTQRFMVQQRQPQVKRQMINQGQGNQTPTQQQAQHQQSAQQSQSPQQQKTQILQQFSPSIQLQSGSGSGQQHIALVKTSTGTMATTGGMTLAQIKPGQLKATLPGVRQMQLQQIPIGQHQQRKNLATGKMTQITQVSSNISGSTTSGTTNVAGTTKTTPVGSTQLIVKNPNSMQQSTLTVQQLMRQTQPNQFVLGKRIIPVSVSSPANQRQTIQVVSAASAASGLAAGTIRTNMSNPHTIKVTGAPQQAIFSVIQQQQQMRQNANQNLRLQGSTSSLVAVAVQPTQQQTTQAQTTPTQSTQKP